MSFTAIHSVGKKYQQIFHTFLESYSNPENILIYEDNNQLFFTYFLDFVAIRIKLQHPRIFFFFWINVFTHLWSFMLIRYMYYCKQQFFNSFFTHFLLVLKKSGTNFNTFESFSTALKLETARNMHKQCTVNTFSHYYMLHTFINILLLSILYKLKNFKKLFWLDRKSLFYSLTKKLPSWDRKWIMQPFE